MGMKQQTIKDLELLIKELTGKLAKETEKSKKLSAEKKILKKKASRDTQRKKELLLSREKTRARSAAKSVKIKILERKLKPKRHHYTTLMVELSVMLRVFCGCSFRGISKILTLLKDYLCLEDLTIPSANTIQNWTSKLGLSSLKNLDKTYLEGDICVIIDECIQMGNSKMLMVLFAPAFEFVPVGTVPNTLSKTLNFSDVRVGYIGYDTSWTAKKIEKVLADTIKDTGLKIAYVVSDEASTLKCAAKLANVPYLADISHILGTCLRKTYNKNEAYKKLFTLINSYKLKGVNQDLTFLLPPKQRPKARFMNQKATITWANTLLSKYATFNEKEKEFFKDLFLHQSILKSLSKCLEVAEFVGLCYKEDGLCLASTAKVNDYLVNITIIDKQELLFINLLKEYVKNYEQQLTIICQKSGLETEKQGICRLNMCSDVIESMFGKYKNTASTNKLVSVPTTSLELPLCHMNITQLQEQIIPSIEETFVADICAWKEGHNVKNQAVRRAKFLKNEQKKSRL